jgi:hypothetical protein
MADETGIPRLMNYGALRSKFLLSANNDNSVLTGIKRRIHTNPLLLKNYQTACLWGSRALLSVPATCAICGKHEIERCTNWLSLIVQGTHTNPRAMFLIAIEVG